MSDPFAGFGGASTTSGSASTQQARVLFDYAAQAANQISLQKGTTIRIMTVGAKGGWSSGIEIATGTFL